MLVELVQTKLNANIKTDAFYSGFHVSASRAEEKEVPFVTQSLQLASKEAELFARIRRSRGSLRVGVGVGDRG